MFVPVNNTSWLPDRPVSVHEWDGPPDSYDTAGWMAAFDPWDL